MSRTPESMFTNPEIARAFGDASLQEGIILVDGNGLKIKGKSEKSTWSKNPGSFETDDTAKHTGPHAGNWVLWTPSTAIEGSWDLTPHGENSALGHVSAGVLRPFARALNDRVRGTTKISKEFQPFRDELKPRIATAALGESSLDLEKEATLLVRASLPEGALSRSDEARYIEEGAIFLEKVVHLGGTACQTLMESN